MSQFKVGDKVKVKPECDVYPGKTGVIVSINRLGDFGVKVEGESGTVWYRRDELERV